MALAAAQVVAAIAARIPGTAYTSRMWPIGEDELPAWRVVAAGEDVSAETLAPDALQKHELAVELRGYASATDDLDDALHALTAGALAAIFATAPQVPPDALDALHAGGLAQIELRHIERDLATEAQATVGVVTITLQALFFTQASAPETIFD